MPRHVFTTDDRRKGGQARAAAPDMAVARQRGGQARQARPDAPLHQRVAGKAGFAATVARHGLAFGLDKVAAHYRANETAGERWVAAALEAAGLIEGWDWERQQPCPLLGPRVLLDFVVGKPGGGTLVVLPGARYWHDPRRAEDRRQDDLLAAHGIDVLRLDDAAIRDTPTDCLTQLYAALGLTADAQAA